MFRAPAVGGRLLLEETTNTGWGAGRLWAVGMAAVLPRLSTGALEPVFLWRADAVQAAVSMRLNDVHFLAEAGTKPLDRGYHAISRFHVEHPEWRLGNRTARHGERWLCARVPASLNLHEAVGIGLPRMVDAGVDMVNLSSFYYTSQAHSLAEIRRRACPGGAPCQEPGSPAAKWEVVSARALRVRTKITSHFGAAPHGHPQGTRRAHTRRYVTDE